MRYLSLTLLALCAVGRLAAGDAEVVSTSQGQEQTSAEPNSSACVNISTMCPDCCPPVPTNKAGLSVGTVICKGRLDTILYTFTSAAADYRETTRAETGCAPCGSGGGDLPALARLPGLEVLRYHRPDMGAGSFGAGVLSNFDAQTQGFHNLPGRGEMIYLWDPTLSSGQQQFDQRPDGTFYAALPEGTMRSLVCYDTGGGIVANFDDAVRVVTTFNDGHWYELEVIGAGLQSRLTRIVDRSGNAITVNYQHAVGSTSVWSDLMRMSSLTDAYGHTATVTYASALVAGRPVISRIDLPTGGAVAYAYADPSLASVSQVTHPDGSISTFTQLPDPASQTVLYRMHEPADLAGHRRRDLYLTTPTWTDPATGTVAARSLNRLRMETNGADEVSFLGWHTYGSNAWHLFSHIYRGGGSLLRFESYLGSPVRESFASDWDLASSPATWTWDVRESYESNAMRFVSARSEADGRRTTYDNDPLTQRPLQTVLRSGATRTATYTPWGNPLQEVDELGRTVVSTYDVADRRLSRTVAFGTPEAATTTWTYNARGQVLEERDPLYNPLYPDLHVTTYGYHAAGLLISRTDAADVSGGVRGVWVYGHDAAGRQTSLTDPQGRVTLFAYDASNRLVKTTYADTSYEETTYGTGSGPEAGQPVSRRDRNGNLTTFSYDAAGRVTQTVRAAATAVAEVETCTYVPGTELKQSCTRAGETTTYGYDYAQRLVSTTVTPRAGAPLTTTVAHDIAGRPMATVDAFGRGAYPVYDAEDRQVRMVRELVPGGSGLDAAVAAWSAAALTTTAWTGTAVGAGDPGSQSISGGSVSITSGGAGIGVYQQIVDGFRFVHQPVAGSSVLTTRLDSLVNDWGWGTGGSIAGVMVRTGTGAGDPYAMVGVNLGQSLCVKLRRRSGLTSESWVVTSGVILPLWLRVEAVGDDLTLSTSADGVTWTMQTGLQLGLGTTAQFGLVTAVTHPGSTATGGFSQTALVRTGPVRPALQAARFAVAAAALPRVLTANPPYVIEESAYDLAGQVLQRTDAAGVVTAFAYDGQGRMTSQTEAVGSNVVATTLSGFDTAGNRIQVTSPRGIVTQFTYTGRNLLASVIEAAGTAEQATTRTMTYSPTRKPLTETDALGRITSYTYGTCCDRLKEIVDPAGYVTAFAYDYVGNRTTVTDPLIHAVTTAYDARHRVSAVTNATAETTVFAYDDNLTDNAGLDAVSAVAAVLPTLGLGAGADGSGVAVTDPLGATSYELRDGLGRTVARIDALGHATTVGYDSLVGDLVETSQSDAIGHVTRVRSDAAGRARQQVDALNNVSTASFDPVGNQVAQRDTLAIGWDAIYDARYRLTQRTSTRVDAVASMIWTYDLDGNRLSETDALGKIETSQYDARNRRTVLTDRLNGVTRFGYDLVGNLLSISDADNEAASPTADKTTQYAYDLRNLLVAEVFPTGQQGRTLRVYGYDGARRLASRQVGILSGAFSATPGFTGASTTTSYGYDNANRLTTRGYPADGADDTFGYDLAGRLTSAASARYASSVNRFYDAAGRLTTESLTVPDGTLVGTILQPTTWSVVNTYLTDNTLATQTYPTGSVVTRTYTPRHELATVGFQGSPVASRTFDAAGRLTQSVAGNGLVETRTYLGGDYAVASIATPGVTGFGYSFDAAGRKLTETDSFATGGGQTFGYDDAGRLTAWTAGVAAIQSWSLTKVGDWLSTTRDGVAEPRVNTAVHEAVQVGPNILFYDVQGNLTKDEKGTALAWDPENRVTSALVTRDASVTGFGSSAAYRYDALGRRIAKTVDGRATFFLPSGAQTVVEIERPALPATQAAIDGAEADGTLANMALTPASGGVLAGSVTRINFQPTTAAIPTGFLRDTGKPSAVRTNGLTYGWSTDSSTQAVIRHGAVPLPEFDTFIQAQPDAGGSASWSIALPDGTYPIIVVAGDALSTEQTNHLVIGGVAVTDATPSTVPAYEAGNFDGYAVSATVTGGVLTIEPGVGAFHAKLCFVEIGQAGTATEVAAAIAAAQPTLAALVAKANAETGATPKPVNTVKEYAYLDYVDAVSAYTVSVNGGAAARYYPAYNHLWSVAALIDSSGAVVERYSYTSAYGTQVKTVMPGKVETGFGRGFTGYIADNETGLLHARARQYSPTLGRFIGRDPAGYVDGLSEYSAYFIPNHTDPNGLKKHTKRLTTRMWINSSAIYSNWGGPEFPEGADHSYDPVMYGIFLAAAAALGDNGDSPSFDDKYRVIGRKNFRINCYCKPNKESDGSTIDAVETSKSARAGSEGPFSGAAPSWYSESIVPVSDSEVKVIFGIYGQPPAAGEAGIQLVRPRTSKRIWNYTEWRFKCQSDGSLISEPLVYYTSNFPSHVLFDGRDPVRMHSQGPVSDLWRSQPGWSDFVIGSY